MIFSGIFISGFPGSPFSLSRTPLLRTILKQGVGRGNSILMQEFGIMIPFYNGQKKTEF